MTEGGRACLCGSSQPPGHDHFGIDVIYVRKLAGVRTHEVASRMGVTRQRVSNVERRVDGRVSPAWWNRFIVALVEARRN